MTVATLPFPTTLPTPSLPNLSLPTLRIGQRELTVEQVFRYLSTSKLLPQLIRDIILEDALQIVPYSTEDLEATGRSLSQQQQYRHLDWDSLKLLALRFLRLEKFKELSWGRSIESYFLKRRHDLDQVICSIIQTPDSSLAQELYFRIQNEEDNFETLAHQYSKSSEAGAGGRLGPLPLSKLHPEIAKHLRHLQAGQMAPVFILGQQCILIRLEQLIPAQMNEQTRQTLIDELFENWLETETAKELGNVLPALLQAPDPILSIVPERLAIPNHPTEESDRSEPTLPFAVPNTTPNSSPNISPNATPRQKPDLARRKRRSGSPLGAWPVAASVIGGMLLATGAGTTYWLSQEQAVEATPTANASILNSQENLLQPAYDRAMTAATLTQVAQTPEQWKQVIEHWQVALQVLTTVPAGHPQFDLAQEKQGLYQRNLAYAEHQHQRQNDRFRVAVEAATAAAAQGQTAATIEDWSAVSALWQTALESMAAVPQDYPRYAIAQQRLPIYQANWEYVQYRIQQAVH